MPTPDPKPKFDSDLSPEAEFNQDAARARGLTYDRRERVYKDSDGCPTRDQFGQPLG